MGEVPSYVSLTAAGLDLPACMILYAGVAFLRAFNDFQSRVSELNMGNQVIPWSPKTGRSILSRSSHWSTDPGALGAASQALAQSQGQGLREAFAALLWQAPHQLVLWRNMTCLLDMTIYIYDMIYIYIYMSIAI